MRETYSERWSSLAGEPTDVISREEAHRRHETGEPYVITLGEPTDPDNVIEIAWKNDYLGVWFFDEQGRRSVQYMFTVYGNQLFLDTMTNWKYPDGGHRLNEANWIKEFEFTPGGNVTVEAIDTTTNDVTTEDYTGVDVSPHWEKIPAFGEWESIIRYDRG